MKILLISVTLCTGGAETFVFRLARKLRHLGFDCSVLNLNTDLEDPRLLKKFDDVPIHRIGIPQIKWIKRIDKALRLLKIDFSFQHQLTRRLFRRRYCRGYDVYHSHLFPADYLAADSAGPGQALVTTFHGDYIHYANQADRPDILNFGRKLQHVLNRLDRLVYISDYQRDVLVSRAPEHKHKFVKVYNGFELEARSEDRIAPPDPDVTTFIMVSRGIKDKGWLTAIRAFQLLRGKVKLMLIGEGEYLDSLRSQHSDPRIEFVGFHASPTDLLRRADIFVFPSIIRSESLPTVIVEALCCGLPVISTDVGEVKRMISAPGGDFAGQLVALDDEDDLVAAFAAAMQRYLDEPDLRLEHSRHALEAFQQFDLERCARAYVHVYEAAAAEAVRDAR